MALGIHCIDVGAWRVVLGKHLDEAAVGQEIPDIPLGSHQDTVAVKGPFHSDLAIVGREISMDPHSLRIARCAAAVAQAPNAVGLVTLPYSDAVVADQIRRAARKAMLGQVSGRRA